MFVDTPELLATWKLWTPALQGKDEEARIDAASKGANARSNPPISPPNYVVKKYGAPWLAVQGSALVIYPKGGMGGEEYLTMSYLEHKYWSSRKTT